MKIIIISLLTAFFFVACEKQEDRIIVRYEATVENGAAVFYNDDPEKTKFSPKNLLAVEITDPNEKFSKEIDFTGGGKAYIYVKTTEANYKRIAVYVNDELVDKKISTQPGETEIIYSLQ